MQRETPTLNPKIGFAFCPLFHAQVFHAQDLSDFIKIATIKAGVPQINPKGSQTFKSRPFCFAIAAAVNPRTECAANSHPIGKLKNKSPAASNISSLKSTDFDPKAFLP